MGVMGVMGDGMDGKGKGRRKRKLCSLGVQVLKGEVSWFDASCLGFGDGSRSRVSCCFVLF